MRCAVLPDMRVPSLCPSSEQSTAFSLPLSRVSIAGGRRGLHRVQAAAAAAVLADARRRGVYLLVHCGRARSTLRE